MAQILKHEHLIISAHVNKPVKDKNAMDAWLKELVKKIDMKIMMGPYSEDSTMVGNVGTTGVVVIETSHIACHTWTEVHPAKIELDVYSCKCVDINAVLEHLDTMEPVKVEYKFLDRENGLKVLI